MAQSGKKAIDLNEQPSKVSILKDPKTASTSVVIDNQKVQLITFRINCSLTNFLHSIIKLSRIPHKVNFYHKQASLILEYSDELQIKKDAGIYCINNKRLKIKTLNNNPTIRNILF
ncbi:hypothetical protein CDAR_220291 [Caerostris darwini]|uniref:Uncharacterized protein n=1 Tax=Caerostris darwini TaxID=1538125 RepID=A0AAV4UFG4_9ARAC|nr:hypothetical protein CDAR_220291 [Caerostris darwini]